MAAPAYAIRRYFQDNPSESQHEFDTSFFQTFNRGLYFSAGDAGCALGGCSADFDVFKITIGRLPDGLGIIGAEVAGYVNDIYDWRQWCDENPGSVQAAYEPCCGWDIGTPFGEKIEVDNLYNTEHFSGYRL